MSYRFWKSSTQKKHDQILCYIIYFSDKLSKLKSCSISSSLDSSFIFASCENHGGKLLIFKMQNIIYKVVMTERHLHYMAIIMME